MTTPFDSFAPFYDALNSSSRIRNDADWICGQLKKPSSILDLGCGTGSLAVELSARGHTVRGVDASGPMVALAKAKGIKATEGDVRAWRDPDGSVYDAVTCLFHVLSYQLSSEDLLKVLRCARANVTYSGRLLFGDLWYGPAVLRHPPEVRYKENVDQDTNHHLIRIARPALHVDSNQVDVRYTLWAADRATQRTTRLSELHRLRYWFLPELRELLHRAGFVMEWIQTDVEHTYDLKFLARSR